MGESACAGNAKLRADDASDEMAVLCEGKDACKGNTRIDCGSVETCSLHCAGATSCEDATVWAHKAGTFECTPKANCDEIGTIKLPSKKERADAAADILSLRALVVAVVALLICWAVAALCRRESVCSKAGYAKVGLADDSEEFTLSEAEEIFVVSD